MNKLKKASSFILSTVILMTHFVAFLHAIHHSENSFLDKHPQKTSNIFISDANSDINLCDICDIYLDAELEELKTSNFTFRTPLYISNKVLQKEEKLISVLVAHKQSRAPPFKIS